MAIVWKGGFRWRLIDTLCLDHLPRGQQLGVRIKGDMVALKMKVACPRRPKSEALQHLAALRFPLLGATGHGNGLFASGAIVLPVVAAGTLPSKPWVPCG